MRSVDGRSVWGVSDSSGVVASLLSFDDLLVHREEPESPRSPRLRRARSRSLLHGESDRGTQRLDIGFNLDHSGARPIDIVQRVEGEDGALHMMIRERIRDFRGETTGIDLNDLRCDAFERCPKVDCGLDRDPVAKRWLDPVCFDDRRVQ